MEFQKKKIMNRKNIKIVKFDTEARTKMLTGVNTLANAVKVVRSKRT